MGALGSFVMQLRRHPLRGLLTLLQVMVGSVAVILIINQYILGQEGIRQMGEGWETVYQVQVFKRVQSGENAWYHESQWISEAIWQELSETPSIRAISPYSYRGLMEVELSGERYGIWGVVGVGPEFAEVADLRLIEGSFFTRADLEHKSQVLVISETMARRWFGRSDVIGETVSFGQQSVVTSTPKLTWTIVGVFVDQVDIRPFDSAPPHQVLIPVTTPMTPAGPSQNDPATRRMYSEYQFLWSRAHPGKLSEAMAELEAVLIAHFPGYEVGFQRVERLSEQIGQAGEELFGVFAAFGFLAILITGLGILTMSLSAIVERTPEIGLRRALGATRSSVFMQFVTEAAVLVLVGGGLGVGVASVLQWRWAEPIGYFGSWFGLNPVTTLSLGAVGLGLLAAGGAGILSSIYPAFQAASISPLEAIREE